MKIFQYIFPRSIRIRGYGHIKPPELGMCPVPGHTERTTQRSSTEIYFEHQRESPTGPTSKKPPSTSFIEARASECAELPSYDQLILN